MGATITPPGTTCWAQAAGIVSGEETQATNRYYGAAGGQPSWPSADTRLICFARRSITRPGH